MSRVPYFADGARWGARMGHVDLVDGMYRDKRRTKRGLATLCISGGMGIAMLLERV